MQTDREQAENRQSNKQTENSKTEATLILCGSSGERANYNIMLLLFAVSPPPVFSYLLFNRSSVNKNFSIDYSLLIIIHNPYSIIHHYSLLHYSLFILNIHYFPTLSSLFTIVFIIFLLPPLLFLPQSVPFNKSVSTYSPLDSLQ